MKTNEKCGLFTNRDLVTLLWPLAIEQALAVLVGMADTAMVSSVGEAAISGVSLVDMINNLIFQVFAALATGGAVVTGQYLGAKNADKAEKSAGQLVMLNGLIGLALAAVFITTRSVLLRFFFGSVEDSVFSAAMIYAGITALSYPFLALYNSGAAIFRALGNSRVSMKVSILVNIINFCGNALCIYGLHMGVAGVAIPTLVSRIAGAWLILFLASRPGQSIRLIFSNIRRAEAASCRKILYIGIPSAAESSIFQLGRVLVVGMITLFGTTHISANAVANTICNACCIAGYAFQLAVITVVARCVGAGALDKAAGYTKKLIRWDFVFQGIGDILVIATLPLTLKLFHLSAETRELTVMLVLIHSAMAILLWPPAFVLPNALRAANDVRFTMTVSVCSMAVCRMGIGYVLCVRMGMGATGIWIAMIIDWICRSIFFSCRFLTGGWKKHCQPGPLSTAKELGRVQNIGANLAKIIHFHRKCG